MDSHGDRVRNGMVDMYHFNIHTAKRNRIARVDLVELCLIKEIMLLELVFHQSERQARAIDREIHIFEQVRDGTDMVLMAMRDDKPLNPILVFLDIAEIRDDQINAEHVAVRECHSAVEDKHIAVALENGDIFADFV